MKGFQLIATGGALPGRTALAISSQTGLSTL